MQMFDAFLIGRKNFSLRPDEPAKIMGVVYTEVTGIGLVPCYRVCYSNYEEALVPFGEVRNFRMVSSRELKLSKVGRKRSYQKTKISVGRAKKMKHCRL